MFGGVTFGGASFAGVMGGGGPTPIPTPGFVTSVVMEGRAATGGAIAAAVASGGAVPAAAVTGSEEF